ncbi:CHRD domain-containing protein [Aestuariivivens sediminis]|uniref:CHRD domain-containing protein n=1 Tax=Aestuariivivens sediminis TaxID=2913557 RepID=UPI001F562F41|nr:CHRD domain-containing protein [Aestuariivivens sediminis]
MKTRIKILMRILLLAAFCLSITRCSNEPLNLEADLQGNALLTKTSNSKSSNVKFNFTTNLSGDNEVPAVETNATGEAIVKISRDESWIYYKLIVANIENVRMSHFHMAQAGTNGGIVVWLYDNRDGQPSGPSNGVIAEGVIMAEDIGGALEGDMAALIEAIRNGNIYVNVHTLQVGSGEIRGQL